MWPDDVAAHKQVRMVFNTIEAVGIDQSATAIEFLKAAEITTLSNCRDQQVTFNFGFGTLNRGHLATAPVGLDDTYTPGPAIIVKQNFHG